MKFKVGDRVGGPSSMWYGEQPMAGVVSKVAPSLGGEDLFLVEWDNGLVSWLAAMHLRLVKNGLERAMEMVK